MVYLLTLCVRDDENLKYPDGPDGWAIAICWPLLGRYCPLLAIIDY